jgi:hypothetical protein
VTFFEVGIALKTPTNCSINAFMIPTLSVLRTMAYRHPTIHSERPQWCFAPAKTAFA